jgi:hypothetical protein
MKVEVTINGEPVLLEPHQESGEGNAEDKYALKDNFDRCLLKFQLKGRSFEITEVDEKVNNSSEELREKLALLVLDIIGSELAGTENTEQGDSEEKGDYDPDAIRVSSKQFSIKLIKEMVDSGDLTLSPDFQRHEVWNSSQRSRLIESILLRIPLPMFYFSEDSEGRLAVVDGLQRITTIRDFMDNRFKLRGLEYLSSCNGEKYETLDPKYKRWFNLTQLSGNVIDPSSPYRVKYDIFRRINTGGTPLNNQEIRNCLAGEGLREILRTMTSLEEFKKASDNSIRPARMEDHEMALRFILFRGLVKEDEELKNYDGQMDKALDELTERLRELKKKDLEYYVDDFSRSMKNAYYLFGGKYAFRKIRPEDVGKNTGKRLINKALFLCWSILLADYDPSKVESQNRKETLTKPIADGMKEDPMLWTYLSGGTNYNSNIRYVFSSAKKLMKQHVKY